MREQDMASFVYSYYLKQYGYSKITESKFLVFSLSVKRHCNLLRVNVFGKFMGLFDEASNFSVDELQKYLEALDYLMNL
jgi:hypothetical protein